MEIDAAGAPAHTRTLVVTIARADAGHVDARGAILDVRKRGLVPMAADLQTAGVIHDMRVDARVALEPPRFEALRVEQPSVAFEPSAATGGECCRDPARRIDALVGAPLDEAAALLGAALGGPRGCSHVLTLAQLLASSAQRGLELDAARHRGAERPDGQRLFHRSLTIDGVQGPDALHLVAQQADVLFAPLRPSADTDPLDRLASRLEIRAHAEVDLDGMALRSLRAAERASDRERLWGAWRDRSGALAGLAGGSALGGMAGRLFERLGRDAADRPLLDALLNLAPTLIQCVPAVMERWQGRSGGARPGLMAGGGMADSCYMWRRGGALHARIEGELERLHAASDPAPDPR